MVIDELPPENDLPPVEELPRVDEFIHVDEMRPLDDLPIVDELFHVDEIPPLVELPLVDESRHVDEGNVNGSIVQDFGCDSDFVCENDNKFFIDAPPVHDNVRGLPSDIGNMDLRRAEGSIYLGKVFKDKTEMRKTLSLYAIKRLFNFKVPKTDKKRIIAVCVDPRCEWRIYGRINSITTNVEIRKVCLKHSCDVLSRSKYGKNASSRILAELMKAKFANGKKVREHVRYRSWC